MRVRVPALAAALGAMALLAAFAASCVRPGGSGTAPAKGDPFVIASDAALQSWAAFLLQDAARVRLADDSPAYSSAVPSDPRAERLLSDARLILYFDRADGPHALVGAARRVGSNARLAAIPSSGTAGAFAWLDPARARPQAAALASVLSEEFPTHANAIEARAARLDRALALLAEEQDSLREVLADRPVLAPDSRVAPLAEGLGLRLEGRRSSRPGQPPLEGDSERFEAAASANPSALFLAYEDQPSADLAELAATLGFRVVAIDPIRRGEADIAAYTARLRRNWRNLELAAAFVPLEASAP